MGWDRDPRVKVAVGVGIAAFWIMLFAFMRRPSRPAEMYGQPVSSRPFSDLPPTPKADPKAAAAAAFNARESVADQRRRADLADLTPRERRALMLERAEGGEIGPAKDVRDSATDPSERTKLTSALDVVVAKRKPGDFPAKRHGYKWPVQYGDHMKFLIEQAGFPADSAVVSGTAIAFTGEGCSPQFCSFFVYSQMGKDARKEGFTRVTCGGAARMYEQELLRKRVLWRLRRAALGVLQQRAVGQRDLECRREGGQGGRELGEPGQVGHRDHRVVVAAGRLDPDR